MNSSSFTILNKVQEITIIPSEITGSYDGLNSYLCIPVNFIFRIPNINLNFDIITITGTLKTQQPTSALCERIENIGYTVTQSEIKYSQLFNFKLGNREIDFFEKNRTGDATFLIEFGIVIHIKDILGIEPKGQYIRSSIGFQVEKSKIHISVPKSIWVEQILKQLGHQSFILIEVPLNHKTLKEAYDNIVSEFILAEDYFKNQDYNKCIAHCRSTLDALTRNLKKIRDNTESETSFKWLKDIDDVTLNWIDKVNKAESAITAKTHHSGLNRDFKRYEAESIYLVTLGLVNFIAHIKPHNS